MDIDVVCNLYQAGGRSNGTWKCEFRTDGVKDNGSRCMDRKLFFKLPYGTVFRSFLSNFSLSLVLVSTYTVSKGQTINIGLYNFQHYLFHLHVLIYPLVSLPLSFPLRFLVLVILFLLFTKTT